MLAVVLIFVLLVVLSLIRSWSLALVVALVLVLDFGLIFGVGPLSWFDLGHELDRHLCYYFGLGLILLRPLDSFVENVE